MMPKNFDCIVCPKLEGCTTILSLTGSVCGWGNQKYSDKYTKWSEKQAISWLNECHENSDEEPHSNATTTWEMYNDDCYYDMWAVRDTADKSFNSQRLFHFALYEDAKAFLELVKKAH